MLNSFYKDRYEFPGTNQCVTFFRTQSLLTKPLNMNIFVGFVIINYYFGVSYSTFVAIGSGEYYIAVLIIIFL